MRNTITHLCSTRFNLSAICKTPLRSPFWSILRILTLEYYLFQIFLPLNITYFSSSNFPYFFLSTKTQTPIKNINQILKVIPDVYWIHFWFKVLSVWCQWSIWSWGRVWGRRRRVRGWWWWSMSLLNCWTLSWFLPRMLWMSSSLFLSAPHQRLTCSVSPVSKSQIFQFFFR